MVTRWLLVLAAVSFVSGFNQADEPSENKPRSGGQKTAPRTDCFDDLLPEGAIARLGTVRFRGEAKAAAVSPNGRWIASTSGRNLIHLWEASTGKRIRSLEVKVWPHDIKALIFSPDGKTLFSGGSTISEWDFKTGRELRQFKEVEDTSILALAFSPNGKTLAAANYKITADPQEWDVRLWDRKSGEKRHLLTGFTLFVEGLAFSPDGNTLATASRDGSLRLWDVEKGKETHRLGDNKPPMRQVAFAPNGKTLASGNWVGEVVILSWFSLIWKNRLIELASKG